METTGGPKNLATLFQARAFEHGDKVLFSYKAADEWKTLSWEDVGKRVERLGRFLILRDIHPGDRVAIFSANRPEWVIADLAILSVGAISVPLYPNTTADQAAYILNHSESKIVFASKEEGSKTLDTLIAALSHLTCTVMFQNNPADVLNSISIAEAEEAAVKVPTAEFYNRLETVGADDLATIIYTSGTTGEPKGVMLTHANIVSNCVAAAQVFPLSNADTCLSFLPLSHALERTGGLYTMIHAGAQIAFAESIAKVGQNLLEIKPTFLISVPRILEKIYSKIYSEIETKSALIRWLFRKATLSSSAPHALWERLFFKRIRNQMGGNLRYMICGGAAMSPTIGQFFQTAGFSILEGYGLTEASPVVSVNPPNHNKLGTVGPALPGVEIKIAPDGEVLVRGPNVMKGYYKSPEATAEAIDERNYLHTGDIGELDSEGYLKLTDRKKELIVTSGGKNIAPAKIENALKAHALIEQACVIGDGEKYVAALLVPNFSLLEARARSENVKWERREELVQQQQTKEWFSKIVDDVNRSLAGYETVKKFAILPQEFTSERGEITPTLKLKRKNISRQYQEIIATLF